MSKIVYSVSVFQKLNCLLYVLIIRGVLESGNLKKTKILSRIFENATFKIILFNAVGSCHLNLSCTISDINAWPELNF